MWCSQKRWIIWKKRTWWRKSIAFFFVIQRKVSPKLNNRELSISKIEGFPQDVKCNYSTTFLSSKLWEHISFELVWLFHSLSKFVIHWLCLSRMWQGNFSLIKYVLHWYWLENKYCYLFSIFYDINQLDKNDKDEITTTTTIMTMSRAKKGQVSLKVFLRAFFKDVCHMT